MTKPGHAYNHTSPTVRINDQPTDKHDTPFDSPFELNFDDHFEDFANAGLGNTDMTGGTSPFIKSEPTDFFFGSNGNNDDFGLNDHDLHGIDPSRLSGNNNTMSQNFGGNHMSSSYVGGNSGIGDDELADLAGSLDDYGSSHLNQNEFFNNNNSAASMPMAMPQHHNNNNTSTNTGLYSHTPDGMPMQSPFLNHNTNNNDNFSFGQHFNMSGSRPVGMPGNNSAMRGNNFSNLDRRVSDALLAASPGATSAIRGLHIGESADYSSSNNIQRTMMQHRHSTSLSNNNNWDLSGQSWGGDSVGTASTAQAIPQTKPQIMTTVMPSFATSLPVKIEGGISPQPFQTQEAKKRRRRECHNIVERRRRDNINERIHDLGNLVPQHRLEDEKVRKHLQTNNNPLSPSIVGGSTSPPAVSSSLPSGMARRTSGASALALPSEDKDKGPNKGDILNSSVAWTRDVMWYMQMKAEQEEKLELLVQQLGGTWPFEKSDEENRMRSELSEVISRNARSNNIRPYSRAAGTGLRVPGYTNLAGDSLAPGETDYASISPGLQQSGMPQSWQHTMSGGLKEEDEFDDDIMM